MFEMFETLGDDRSSERSHRISLVTFSLCCLKPWVQVMLPGPLRLEGDCVMGQKGSGQGSDAPIHSVYIQTPRKISSE